MAQFERENGCPKITKKVKYRVSALNQTEALKNIMDLAISMSQDGYSLVSVKYIKKTFVDYTVEFFNADSKLK